MLVRILLHEVPHGNWYAKGYKILIIENIGPVCFRVPSRHSKKLNLRIPILY